MIKLIKIIYLLGIDTGEIIVDLGDGDFGVNLNRLDCYEQKYKSS